MASRVEALLNPNSSYYRNVTNIIRRAQVDAETAAKTKLKVVIPFKVDATSVAEYERRFGWRIVVENHGLRSKHSAHVAGLTYCMALRNMVALGRDGEEVIAVDGDLPLVAAKGMAYVKVVRTSSSNHLIGSYTLEDVQLQRLECSGNLSVKSAAAALSDDLRQGGGSRVFLDPCDASIRGDSVVVDHSKTSMSLAQAVACASAWRATRVRGVCFFQPEMLVSTSGRLSAFPGEYVIDESRDVITYVPDKEPETCFSHSWSALRSFFMNHECVYDGKTWLVEKHLGEDGIFHYVAARADEPWEFPTELGANYYSADLTEWVELEYPTRGGVADGASATYWRRGKTKLLKSLYDKTMAVMLAVDPKRLTRDEVLGVMRAYNNTSVVGGDTVRRPTRVYVGDLEAAATPLLAQAVYRRAAASASLGKALGVLRRRYAIADEGVMSLFWEVCCSGLGFASNLSVATALGEGAPDLFELVDGHVDMSVLAREVPTSILVTQVVGAGVSRDCGAMLPGMPGHKPAYVIELLKRARRFAVTGSLFDAISPPSSACETDYVDVETDSDATDVAVGAIVELPREEPALPPISSDLQQRLFDKLVSEQDAAVFVKPPRLVNSFEATAKRESSVPTPYYGYEAMQEDYDDGYPGVAMTDAEMVPYVAATEDTVVTRDAYMSINDSKREIPRAKMIRRSKGRGGASGMLPRSQLSLMAAMGKRNTDVPTNREHVDFFSEPKEVVDAVRRTCFVENWREVLEKHLHSGLWQPTAEDLRNYVSKVDSSKAEMMLKEFFSVADVDMRRWLVMTKGKAKPPMDPGADQKVPLPQTIMYNESKGMNAMYSSIMSRFHDVHDELLIPNVRFNDRRSPAEHEVWFNTLEPLRRTCKQVYRAQGDSFNFDRSQELMAFAFELCYYREHGLDAVTLELWKQTMGVKTAVSLMHGIVTHIVLQGLSGIFKTLFRNGLVTLGAVVVSTKLDRRTLISLDVKGDDYTIETSAPFDVASAIQSLAWKFNFSAKLWGCDYLYFCSRYWVYVDGWWHWVADPDRKFESVSAAVVVNERGEDCLAEKWISLRDDLRHYDNGLVAEELATAVAVSNPRRTRPPVAQIGGLARMAADRDFFFGYYGPTERVGL